MKRLSLIFILSVLLFCSVGADAHPDVFTKLSLTFVFNDEGLFAIKEKWVFDEAFSSILINDYDVDGNNKLDAAEIKRLTADSFDGLSGYKYFNFIKKGSTKIAPVEGTNFNPYIEKNKVVYEFLLPYQIKSEKNYTEIFIDIFDPEIFIDFTYEEPPCRIEKKENAPIEAEWRIKDNSNIQEFFNQKTAYKTVILKFRRKL